MRLFLDTSVLLAASGSANGASSEIFRRSASNGWILIATPYTIDEVLRNLPLLPPSATSVWARLRFELQIMDDVFTLDRPALFEGGKDRPILFSALAWADYSSRLIGSIFHGLWMRRFMVCMFSSPARCSSGNVPRGACGELEYTFCDNAPQSFLRSCLTTSSGDLGTPHTFTLIGSIPIAPDQEHTHHYSLPTLRIHRLVRRVRMCLTTDPCIGHLDTD